ncbi:MAG: nucleotidyl transferase AbiEii/AbiGii toxin family protein [Lachnospiraceae bacterium]|nr:nucleotidyl transferase AbiEii/AbiGii toxin family protein [Lachnospiraceae bacterium]
MYLHSDKELFREVVISTSEELGIAVPIVEKDYYVTVILKCLSEERPECVFKGGTSLSKCHHVIERFSEDIDIAFSNDLTQGMRKKLKNGTIFNISQELQMPILDWENARSRRDYNCYLFSKSSYRV